MRRIGDLTGQELKWSAAHWLGNEYRLRAGGEDVAILRFHGWLHCVAKAESGDGCWRFSRAGLLQARVAVRPCDEEREIAVFTPSVWNNGGVLVLTDGRRYRATSNLWMTSYEFATEDRTPLVRYRLSGIIKRSAALEILPAATDSPELPWIVLLGWYLHVQLNAQSGVGG